MNRMGWLAGVVAMIATISLTADESRAAEKQAERLSAAQRKGQAPASRADAAGPEGIVRSEEDPQDVTFPLTTFVVEGNTILEQTRIDRLLESYTGAGRRMKDVEQARAELEKLYHAAGYPTVLVNLPEQTIENGLVRLQVVEGILLTITVTGNEHFSWVNIRGKLPSLTPGALIYEPTLVKELATVNSNPDLSVTPLLKPGPVPGTVDLELKVKDRLPIHGKLEADNRGPITTPQNRLLAEIQHTNVFGHDEILTLNTVQTPTDWGAVQNYGVSFVYPVQWPDHLLAVYASKSESNSVLTGAAVSVGGASDVGIAGNATIAGARYIFPIFKGGKNAHQLSIGIDYKRLEETSASFPGGDPAVVLGPIQYTPASLAYTGLYPDQWWPDYVGQTKAALSVRGYVAGIMPGGDKQDFAGDPNNPFESPGLRRGSTGTFAVLQGGLDRVQTLPADFSLLLRASGQWASEPLIPAEQFFAGGFDTVRGYLQFEAIGDNAVLGRAELTTPEVLKVPIDRIWQRRRSSDMAFRLRFATFYDVAKLWVLQAPPGQLSQFNLEGVGFGVRVKFPRDVGQLILDSGWALKDTLVTKRGANFVHFSVGLTF